MIPWAFPQDIMGTFEGTIEASNLLSIKDEGVIDGKVIVGKLAVEAWKNDTI